MEHSEAVRSRAGRELALHVGESPSDDLDVFGAHARAEGSEGRVSILLSIATIAVLIGAVAFFWK